MDAITHYLDRIEAQVCRDGFMTHSLRRHLDDLGRVAPDDETGRRIEHLVARYNVPYAERADMDDSPVTVPA
ncbi:hypothetical protein [Indioceanicola profundi]|uniref:hypothetical protein n=1 Tax=Indioceanicola profundi TaxID=2220096 RepID=UPI000E6AB9D5|nr:hypothetical protein [Indioceanicola profundi]